MSLTSIVYNIFETIIRDKITILFESHELITHHQHGFMTGDYCKAIRVDGRFPKLL